MNRNDSVMFDLPDEHRALWNRLEAYSLDAPAAKKPFSVCLADKEGWSHEFTLRAIDEYKRFVFIALTAGHLATPSKIVDAVWHQHLHYTRDYWERFCPEVLGKPLHHTPGDGADDEARMYQELYAKTLDSYRRIFNCDAPSSVWPAFPDSNEQDDSTMPRVPTRSRRRVAWVVGMALGLLATGASATDLYVLDYRGPAFLLFFIEVSFGVVALSVAAYLLEYCVRRAGTASSRMPTQTADLHEAAFLRGGAHRMAQVAALDMLVSGLMSIDVGSNGRGVVMAQASESSGPYRAEHDYLFIRGRLPYVDLHRKLLQRVPRMELRMQSHGWW
jgi:hypothetical protein